ncbi:iron ABC transporter permease [Lentibacillus sp. N15]|uniref:ABC transporter permease n=1 Tax=Lentibacillus songyuanensis TaxID=3136161 RepID=UPI0031BB5E15
MNTLKLDVAVTVLGALIGVTTAWFIERTNLPGKKIWNALVTLPFAVPAFVSSYSWISIYPGFEGFGGAVLILTLSSYPLVHLPVAAALRGMDPALEETSRSLGYGRTATFFRVTLPQLRPSLLGGAILIALHMLAEFGSLAFLNYETFTTAIFDQYNVVFDSASAAMLTFVLLILCLFILGLEMLIRGTSKYAVPRKGAPGKLEVIKLGWKMPFTLIGFSVLTFFAVGIPLGTITYWLVIGSSATFIFTEVSTALYATLSFGLGGSVLTIIFALPLVVLAIRYRGAFSAMADRLPYFIHSLPGLVIGLTLVFFAVRFVYPLYQTTPLLLIGYAMLYLPLAQSSIRGAMEQVPKQLEETAGSLGKRPLTIFFKVTLPIISPGVGAGLALVFLEVMKELTATLLLRPTGIDTLATKIWEHTSSVEYAASAPYAALLILISGLPVYLLTMRSFTHRKKEES